MVSRSSPSHECEAKLLMDRAAFSSGMEPNIMLFSLKCRVADDQEHKPLFGSRAAHL